jgi:hypothetical protein
MDELLMASAYLPWALHHVRRMTTAVPFVRNLPFIGRVRACGAKVSLNQARQATAN